METIKLSSEEWMDVCYALSSKKRQLEEMGLEEEAKNMERIRMLISAQLL
jgi:hypothetical protein